MQKLKKVENVQVDSDQLRTRAKTARILIEKTDIAVVMSTAVDDVNVAETALELGA